MKSDFVAVYKGSDPIEMTLLEGYLKQHGLNIRVLGTRHGAGVGAAPHIFELRLEVSIAEEQEARALVAEYFASDSDRIASEGDTEAGESLHGGISVPAELPWELRDEEDDGDGVLGERTAAARAGRDADREGDERLAAARAGARSSARASGEGAGVPPQPSPGERSASRPSERTPTRSSRLSPMLATGVVLFFPGACHIYARRPWTALWIALGEVAALTWLVTEPAWAESMIAATLLAASLLFDLVGGQLAVRHHNRLGRISRGKQSVIGVLGLMLAVTLAIAIGPLIPWSPPEPEPDTVPLTGGQVPTPPTDPWEGDADLRLIEQLLLLEPAYMDQFTWSAPGSAPGLEHALAVPRHVGTGDDSVPPFSP